MGEMAGETEEGVRGGCDLNLTVEKEETHTETCTNTNTQRSMHIWSIQFLLCISEEKYVGG